MLETFKAMISKVSIDNILDASSICMTCAQFSYILVLVHLRDKSFQLFKPVLNTMLMSISPSVDYFFGSVPARLQCTNQSIHAPH